MKKARKKSPWMQHVAKQMAAMPGVALREVLKAASKTYKKGKGVTKKVLGIRKQKKQKNAVAVVVAVAVALVAQDVAQDATNAENVN